MDENGKVHFGDRKSAPRDSEPADINSTNVAEPTKIRQPPPKPKEKSAEVIQQEQAALAAQWKGQFCRDDVVYEFYFNDIYGRCMPHSSFEIVICERRPPRDFQPHIGSLEPIITGGNCPAGFPKDMPENAVFFKKPK